MAINQIRFGSDIANLASSVTGTILKNRTTEHIAEEDRQSREMVEANKLEVEERLKKLGFSYDMLETIVNNASKEEIAKFQSSMDAYIAWLKENGLSERLDTQLSHDKWVTAYTADSSYFNNMLSSFLNLVGKTGFDNLGLQNILGADFMQLMNTARTQNFSDFIKGVNIDGKENLNIKGGSQNYIWPQTEVQKVEGQISGFNDDQRIKRQGGKGWTF